MRLRCLLACTYLLKECVMLLPGMIFKYVMPIETGRWSRKPRQDCLCDGCGVLGDEKHAIIRLSEG